MTLISDFHNFKEKTGYQVWIKEKNVGYYIIRREKVGGLLTTDSCYYYLFSNYALNYRWMEEYEKPLGPALEFSQPMAYHLREKLYRNLEISAIVVSLYDKTNKTYNFVYKLALDAFRWMDKHRLWFGGFQHPPVGFLPVSELSSTDPLQ